MIAPTQTCMMCECVCPPRYLSNHSPPLIWWCFCQLIKCVYPAQWRRSGVHSFMWTQWASELLRKLPYAIRGVCERAVWFCARWDNDDEVVAESASAFCTLLSSSDKHTYTFLYLYTYSQSIYQCIYMHKVNFRVIKGNNDKCVWRQMFIACNWCFRHLDPSFLTVRWRRCVLWLWGLYTAAVMMTVIRLVELVFSRWLRLVIKLVVDKHLMCKTTIGSDLCEPFTLRAEKICWRFICVLNNIFN